MARSEHSFEQLIENPDLATHEDLLAMANEMATPEESQTQVETESAPASAAEPTEVVVETPAAEVEAPITSRDGKHTIPYDVLKNARESAQTAEQARQAAEARAAELAERASSLEAQLLAAKAGDQTATQQTEALPDTISKEEIDTLREDFPVLAKMMDAQNATVAELKAQLANVSHAEAARQAVAAQAENQSVQDLIDANPKLSFLQTTDPVAWDQAVKMDDFLKTQPGTRNLSMADRFNKVVSAYEAVNGVINAPATTQQQTDTNTKTPAEIRAEAAKVVGSIKPAAPNSLSDLPGGTHVASEQANLETMSSTQIGARLSAMTPEAREAYLNSLG